MFIPNEIEYNVVPQPVVKSLQYSRTDEKDKSLREVVAKPVVDTGDFLILKG